MTAPPGTSNRCHEARLAGAPVPRGIRVIAPSSTSAAAGAETSRVSRQLTSVSRPDSTRPSEKPLAPNTV